MYSTFINASIAAVALSLNIKNELGLIELELPDTSPAVSFAQTSTETIPADVCQRTANMIKEELPDFYSIYKGNSKFSDASFSHESGDPLGWAD